MNPILLAIPFFILSIGLELIAGWKKKEQYYTFSDTITNLNLGIGSQIAGSFIKTLILLVTITVYERFRLFTLPTNAWTIFACLVLFDFIFYWAHRWSHEVGFFWGAHVVHHQSEEYNLSVALRQSWFQNLISFFLFLPIPLLGFAPEMIFGVAAFHTLYQFWIHTKAIGKLGPLEWIFNTPSHHRVHHAVNPKYIDKNHAGLFIIWDKLFGTFQEEEEEATYGITKPLQSWNPIWANYHFYHEMIQQAKNIPNWKDKLKLIIAPPGWVPPGVPSIYDKKPAFQKKYETPQTLGTQLYILIQFIVILVGSIQYLRMFSELDFLYQIYFAGLIIFSMLICSGILENKPWAIAAEYARLAIGAVTIPMFYYFWYADWFWFIAILCSILAIISLPWFTIAWKKWMKIDNNKILTS
ncbi:MAG: sterol desaturase family protein [Bacteroidia bacterium]|nr:sterol desaturase family protein [Bacteroidia bacterium]